VNKKVIIIGDSIGMHNIEDGLDFDYTYANRLNNSLKDCLVYFRNRRGNTSRQQIKLQHIHDDISCFPNSLFIMQLGIVDCAPRVLGKYESIFLSLLPDFLTRPIKYFISKYRFLLTKSLKRTYIGQDEFDSNIKKILYEIKRIGSTAIVLSIIANNELENKSFGIRQNIKNYNAILKEKSIECNFIFLDLAITSEDFQSDGIHLKSSGQEKIFDQVLRVLKKNDL